MVIVCVRAKCAQSTQLHDVLGLETIRNGCLRQFLQACFVGRQRTETFARIASIICDGYAYQMNTPHTLYSQPGQRDRPCHSLFSLFIKKTKATWQGLLLLDFSHCCREKTSRDAWDLPATSKATKPGVTFLGVP